MDEYPTLGQGDVVDGKTGEVMDLAARSDRRALFAGLQAALGVIHEMTIYRVDGDEHEAALDEMDLQLDRVIEALEVGAEVGSPEHLRHLDRKQEG